MTEKVDSLRMPHKWFRHLDHNHMVFTQRVRLEIPSFTPQLSADCDVPCAVDSFISLHVYMHIVTTA